MPDSPQKQMFRSIEVKLRPAGAATEARISRTLDLCRNLYNAALEEKRKSYDRFQTSPSFFDQCKSFTEIRQNDKEYADLDVTMVRITSLKRNDLAVKAFYARCKRGETPGYPRFKGKDRFDTLVFGDRGWKRTGLSLQIKGIGRLRLTSSPTIKGTVRGLKLVRRESGLYCQFLMSLGEAPALTESKNPVGIDVGLETFATLSDDTVIENPRFLKRSQEKLKALQRSLSTKQRGSNGRKKAKAKLARESEKIANRRKNFLHQITRDLVNRYDGFFVEKLDIKQMIDKNRPIRDMTESGKRGLRRSIMDAAWSMFSFFLGYKAEEAGKPKRDLDPWGTSARCSGCGKIVWKTLKTRQHSCPCGLVINRDFNSAINILDLGLKVSGEVATENHDEH